MPAAHGLKAARSVQPVQKIHQVVFRAHDRQAPSNSPGPPRQEVAVVQGRGPRDAPSIFFERLSPPAKFGDFAPALAQIIAHDSGFLRAQMPNEMLAFSRHLPTEAYQATLDRSRYLMRDVLPLNAAA